MSQVESAVHEEPAVGEAQTVSATGSHWLWPGILTVVAVVAILGLFLETGVSMVSIWWRSDTFAHGFVIVPISAYLIWADRRYLAGLKPCPSYPGLLLLFGLGFTWFLAKLVDVQVVQQYSMVAMIPVTVLTLLGWQVTRAMLFPLAFLLFAVPVGEALIYPMMELTAKFTIIALKLTGLPVYAEGTFITIPSGRWSVVEGCSGIRYLIASVTLGCLYAYVMYRSLWRRLVFVALSILVPIIGNWLRAFMIVMIGHLSDMRLAVGVDHILYGWVFFGLIIGLLFFVGAFWREDTDRSPAAVTPEGAVQDARTIASTKWIPVFMGVLIVSALWPGVAYRLESAPQEVQPVAINTPAVAGPWRLEPGMSWNWKPHYIGADAEMSAAYRNAESGATVGIFLEYYKRQRQGAELVNSRNLMVVQKHKIWRNVGEHSITVTVAGEPIEVRVTRLRSADTNLLVWHWLWIGEHYVSNPYLAKLYEVKTKLFGSRSDGAAIIVVTEYEDNKAPPAAALQQFLDDMLPSIETALNDAGGS